MSHGALCQVHQPEPELSTRDTGQPGSCNELANNGKPGGARGAHCGPCNLTGAKNSLTEFCHPSSPVSRLCSGVRESELLHHRKSLKTILGKDMRKITFAEHLLCARHHTKHCEKHYLSQPSGMTQHFGPTELSVSLPSLAPRHLRLPYSQLNCLGTEGQGYGPCLGIIASCGGVQQREPWTSLNPTPSINREYTEAQRGQGTCLGSQSD